MRLGQGEAVGADAVAAAVVVVDTLILGVGFAEDGVCLVVSQMGSRRVTRLSS